MSEESDIALEEIKEGSTRMDTRWFFKGLGSGYKLIVKNY